MPQPEVWLRGPIDGVPSLLQPVAHALMQVAEEVERILADFPDALLWERPNGVAAVGFHLKHIPGVIDRLFTYAREEELNSEQKRSLVREGEPEDVTKDELVTRLQRQVDAALAELRTIDQKTLTDHRGVGRKQLPSTVAGLLFHAAEHSMRHMGQLLVTARVLEGEGGEN